MIVDVQSYIKDDKMLSFCMKIDSLSAMLNEFEMHSVFC